MSDTTSLREQARNWLIRALGVPTAFPWQLELLDRMLAGDLPGSIDVPTGLGKTAVIAIWMAARAATARVPCRLVYVVDRRAVVDQATAVAEALREFIAEDDRLKEALCLDGRPLAISTLRGQYLDNREWLADPSAPAVVVGTIDMVGSRLLFEGYGVSRRMRPYHAGLLGADSLIVLDEAHLVPPFEHLIRTIARASESGLGRSASASNDQVPPLRVLPLSATGRSTANALTLSDADRADRIVARRLVAKKDLVMRLRVEPKELPERLAEEAWALTADGTRPVRCIVFCDRRNDAQAVRDQFAKRAGHTISPDEQVELLVGGRRVWERTAAQQRLSSSGFLAGSGVKLGKPAFVIATAAGEVGIDLDADHMVSDLVAWERMVQRLGRVNRRGDGAAQVVVIPVVQDEEAIAGRLDAVEELLRDLPRSSDGALDASPGALTGLKSRAETDARIAGLITSASTPEPLYPRLTRPVVEAWSMTSLEEHTGRPSVERWIRGWIDDEAQITIVWREVLPVTADRRRLLPGPDLDAFFAAAGPHLAEQLETEAWRAWEWLTKRTRHAASSPTEAGSPPRVTPTGGPDEVAAPSDITVHSRPMHEDEIIAVVLHASTGPRPLVARDLLDRDKRVQLERRLAGATILVDVRLGGLRDGLLAEDSDRACDVTMQRWPNGEPVVPVRIRRTGAPVDASDAEWRQEVRIAIAYSDDGDEIEWLVVDSLVTAPAESEEGRSAAAKRDQELDEHEEWTERAAGRLARRLGLDQRYADMLTLAARLHDEGKRAKRWQQAFHAPGDAVYAKTRSRPNVRALAGYRHELGSLPRAERDPRVHALDDDLRDLCLHLIAAHHGHARPLLRTDGAEEPPSKLEACAREIALRFARLEKRWGPWGLAWWEALLRAADQQASRQNDEGTGDG